tara:strand:+ start:61 stop:675 length:615 start_codon:yes stop_codon:yes gene_type:complete
MNFIEDLGVRGYLQIAKVYKDKPEEIVFDDHNVIVSGMGVGLSHFFTGSGADTIVDYQNDRFQVGVSGPPIGGSVSSIYQLSGPLSSVSEYGVATNFAVVSGYQIENGVVSPTKDNVFGYIPFKNVTRINETSVRYTIILDEDSANYTNYVRDASTQSLTEIGLFMKNPRGLADDASILVAYRAFNQILKTSDFSLVFRWTINF